MAASKTPDFDFLPGRLSGDPVLRFFQQMSTHALYKGVGLILLGLSALGFAWWARRRGERNSFGYWFFVSLAGFIFLYGAYLVLTRPDWWQVPRIS